MLMPKPLSSAAMLPAPPVARMPRAVSASTVSRLHAPFGPPATKYLMARAVWSRREVMGSISASNVGRLL